LALTFFQQLVSGRRSIRRYLERSVEREKIMACIEAARLAPSADNVQPWRFLVIDDPQLKEGFSREAFSGIYSYTKFAGRAPVIIVILARLDLIAHRVGQGIQGTPFHFLDIGISGEHFVLQAEELGLGTCWIGWFNIRRVRKFLKIPRRYKIIALLTLGYYSQKPARERKLKSITEIAWFNKIEEPHEVGEGRRP
jgi:nitroreductase